MNFRGNVGREQLMRYDEVGENRISAGSFFITGGDECLFPEEDIHRQLTAGTAIKETNGAG